MKTLRKIARLFPYGMLAFAFLTMSASIRAQDESAKKDILCANAPPGSVPKLPEIVTHWVTVLCTPSGHALAPEINDKAVVWAQANGQPFMLTAAPSDWKRPDSLSKYDMRFTAFAAGERTGDALQQTMKMWDMSFGHAARPNIEHVVQLDARSVWNGTIYNLFFYVTEGRPRWIIVCMDRCKSSVPLKVIDLDAPGAH